MLIRIPGARSARESTVDDCCDRRQTRRIIWRTIALSRDAAKSLDISKSDHPLQIEDTSRLLGIQRIRKLPRITRFQSIGHNATMQFSSKSFRATLPNSIAAKYRKALQKHPFALFGLPFLATIVAGSFMLTPATALRYERYDRKNQQISQEEAMGLGQDRRKVNMKDEYYVSGPLCIMRVGKSVRGFEERAGYRNWSLTSLQRLQAKDLEDWEQRRVKRLPGEPDGTLV